MNQTLREKMVSCYDLSTLTENEKNRVCLYCYEVYQLRDVESVERQKHTTIKYLKIYPCTDNDLAYVIRLEYPEMKFIADWIDKGVLQYDTNGMNLITCLKEENVERMLEILLESYQSLYKQGTLEQIAHVSETLLAVEQEFENEFLSDVEFLNQTQFVKHNQDINCDITVENTETLPQQIENVEQGMVADVGEIESSKQNTSTKKGSSTDINQLINAINIGFEKLNTRIDGVQMEMTTLRNDFSNFKEEHKKDMNTFKEVREMMTTLRNDFSSFKERYEHN